MSGIKRYLEELSVKNDQKGEINKKTLDIAKKILKEKKTKK